jgi:hypothetical protein
VELARAAGPATASEGADVSEDTTARTLAEAKRATTEWLHKSGTPEYDLRAHERAIEAERKAQDAYDAAHRE